MTKEQSTKRQRPLSPHLQIYKPQITSVLSITHRFSGIALMGGFFLLTAWFAVLAAWPSCEFAISAMTHPIGQIILIGLTFSLFYNMAHGIRHTFWDYAMGFELDTVNKTAWAIIGFSVIATALVWLF